MIKLICFTPCLALAACAANGPAVSAGTQTAWAASVGDAACGAGNYSYLVGRPVPDAREITDREYRLALGGAAAVRADRVTLLYDAQSQRITEVRCG